MGGGWWISSRSGWLLELLRELIMTLFGSDKKCECQNTKNVNAKNTSEQDMNSLITQPFKFHLGLKEEKARPNLFLGQY